jgi:hypothetical protein
MLLRAMAELGLDVGRSYLVGDKVSDLEAGAAAGTRTILVRTGHGRAVRAEELDRDRLRLVAVVPDLAAALTLCLPEVAGRKLILSEPRPLGSGFRTVAARTTLSEQTRSGVVGRPWTASKDGGRRSWRRRSS